MIRLTKYSQLSLAVMALMASSCTFNAEFGPGDPIEGCTDPDSKNYNSVADVEDGSCTYEMSVIFWYREALANALVANGYDNLTYIVNDSTLGTYPASQYYDGAGSPACGHTSGVTYVGEFNTKSTTISFTVERASDGRTLFQDQMTLTANACEDAEFIL